MATDPHIGTTIRRARERLRLRQQDLADRLGVSRNSVDAWENGRSYPRRSIGALEAVLGIDLTDLPETPNDKLADLYPAQDRWEADVLADPDLPDRIKRRFILDSRAARAVYPAPETGSPPRQQEAG